MSINKLFYLFVIVMLSSSILSADIKNSDNGLDKVSLQLQWIDQFQFAGYYIAKKKGFYKDV
ncbi:MAG: myristoyl transferase, partial [Campylobacterota bacterium]|nr:myristoyl transferase [Campylobacterota bacterium]